MQFRFFTQALLLCGCTVFNGAILKWRLYVLLQDKEYINKNIWFASQHFKRMLCILQCFRFFFNL